MSYKEFADRPQELQAFIQRKSPTGSISKDAQKIIDDATDVIYGKKKSILNGVDVKVSATMPSDTVITADTNGVVAVDAAFTPDVANVTDVLSKRTGLKFGYAEYYQNGKKNAAYNGHYDPTTKTIYFRKGASEEEIIYKTAVHELTHFAESSKHYAYVSDFVLNKKFEGVDSDAYKKAVKDKIAAYAKNGIELTPEEARRELVAENIREVIFETEKDVDNLVRTDYTFAQRILDIIDSFIYHFNNTFGRLKGDAKILADLEQARRKYRLALASAKGMRAMSAVNNSYSIVEIKGAKGNYGVGVLLDTDIFEGVAPRSWNKVLSRFVYEKLAGRTIEVVNVDGKKEHISFAKQNERVQKDGARNSHKVVDKLVSARGNVNALSVVHIDELLRTATWQEETGEHSHQWLDENGWERKKAYVQTRNGVIYETILSIARARDGRRILYSLSHTKRIDEGGIVSNPNGKDSLTNHQFSIKNISQTDPTVKNQFSFSSPKSDTEESIFDAEAESAHQNEQQDFTPAPGVEKSPTDNADVAAIVNADGNKRTDDIELQYSQHRRASAACIKRKKMPTLQYKKII